MNNIFLTGMVRSGTTLLEKLLSNHDEISILSQPFPQLFTGVKKGFHKYIEHPEMYYVLNSFIDESGYSVDDFTHYLDSTSISSKLVSSYLKEKYSGQLTSINKISDDSSKFFIEWYKELSYLSRHKNNAKLVGSKEVMCEEYIPYFAKYGIKSIIIIRDPRDVIASIHYGKGSSFVGNHRPILFDLQNWRKSFYFALGNIENKNVYFLKYEDLVRNPILHLNKIADFLGINYFTDKIFSNGIKSQDGTLWKGNSSFKLDKIISKKSVGNYKYVLDKKTIDFIESVCDREMNYLKYEHNKNKVEHNILNFIEPFEVQNESLKKKYLETGYMRELEVDRLSSQETRSYIYKDNYIKLRGYNE